MENFKPTVKSDFFTDLLERQIGSALPLDRPFYLSDGIKHCVSCNKPLEKVVTPVEFPILTRNICVKAPCDCDLARIAAEEEREKEEKYQREYSLRQQRCFGTDCEMLVSATFENDDRKNGRLSDALKRYCQGFSGFAKAGQGILLHGNVGCGKSYLAACIANELLKRDGMSVKFVNFPDIASDVYTAGDRSEYIRRLTEAKLVIFDDFGAERNTGFTVETAYSVIDARCRSGKPMIVTTNIPFYQLKQSMDLNKTRIYDRILGCCVPIEVKGNSRRISQAVENQRSMLKELGL